MICFIRFKDRWFSRLSSYIISGKNYNIHTLNFIEFRGQTTSQSLEKVYHQATWKSACPLFLPYPFANVKNIATADNNITTNVIQTTEFDNQPLRCSPMIFLFRAMRAIRKISGTAATPLKTAVKTNALIGSIPIKFIINPISVAMVIIP